MSLVHFEADQELSINLNDGKSITAIVRGARRGRYLLIESPDLRFRGKEGDDLIVRMFHKGFYHGFTSRIVGYHREINLTIISFPQDTVTNSMRKSERFKLLLPIIFEQSSSGHNDIPAKIFDLSEGGLGIECHCCLEKKTTVRIFGIFGKNDAVTAMEATVIWAEQDGISHRYGLCWKNPGPDDKKIIADFIDLLTVLKEEAHITSFDEAMRHISPEGLLCRVERGKDKNDLHLRGYSRERFILTEIPLAGGKSLANGMIGEPATIRLALPDIGVLYSFETDLKHQYTRPGGLWVWSYPLTVTEKKLRKSVRQKTMISARMFLKGSSDTPALIMDFCEEGALLITSDVKGAEVGASGSLTIPTPDGKRIDNIGFTIRAVKSIADHHGLGVSFDAQSPEITDLYQQLLGARRGLSMTARDFNQK